jgi:hypothetical protein
MSSEDNNGTMGAVGTHDYNSEEHKALMQKLGGMQYEILENRSV